MKRKFAFQNVNSLDRRAVTYSVSTALIATIFLISMVGIFTGRFRPFASEVQQSVIGTAQQGISIPPAQLQFSYKDGVSGTAQSNALSFTIGSVPQAIISLQGIVRNDDIAANLGVGGVITLKDSNGKTLVTKAEWGGQRAFLDDTKINTPLSNQTILDVLDSKKESDEITYIIKPQYYLAVSAKAKAGDDTVTFPQAPVGDLNQDNVINGADFAEWGAFFEQPVTAETTKYDFNKDGQINGADFALAYTDNFNKSGEGL